VFKRYVFRLNISKICKRLEGVENELIKFKKENNQAKEENEKT